MSKRFNNRRMLYVLGILMVILGITFLVKIPHEKSTLKERLVDIDTAKVSKIEIMPRLKEGEPFLFSRRNGQWIVSQGEISGAPEKGAVDNILAEINNIKPKSLEAVDRSGWSDFNLTDSLATRVRLIDSKGKTMADLMIGRFAYNQPANPYSGGGYAGIEGTSYVRLHDEKKVYGVDGFLALTFSGKFSDYRDKTFVNLENIKDVTRISFNLPSDSSFVLARKDTLWYAGNVRTDSLATAEYLNGLRYINGEVFRDNFKTASNPAYQGESLI